MEFRSFQRHNAETIDGISRSTRERLIKEKLYPEPVPVTSGRIAFVREEVERWVRDRIAARDEGRAPGDDPVLIATAGKRTACSAWQTGHRRIRRPSMAGSGPPSLLVRFVPSSWPAGDEPQQQAPGGRRRAGHRRDPHSPAPTPSPRDDRAGVARGRLPPGGRGLPAPTIHTRREMPGLWRDSRPRITPKCSSEK